MIKHVYNTSMLTLTYPIHCNHLFIVDQFSKFFEKQDAQQLYDYSRNKLLHKLYRGIIAKWKKPYQRKQIRRQRIRLAQLNKQPIQTNMEKLIIHNAAVGIQYPAPSNSQFVVVKVDEFQYKLMNDAQLVLDRKPSHELNQTMIFDEVLFYGTNTYSVLGRPVVSSVVVEGVIESMSESDKVLVFKKKRRKQYKRSYGSRVPITTCRITNIIHNLTNEMLSRGINQS